MGQTLTVESAGAKMGLYEAQPKGAAKGAVIVIQEAFGVTDHIKDVCDRFAAEGYLAVAPHIFHRTGDPIISYDRMQDVLPHVMGCKVDGLVADVDAALVHLKGAGFEPKQVGIVGFCLGGSVAFLIAARREIGASVTFYGGGITAARFGGVPMVEAAPALKTPWIGLYGDVDLTIPFTEVEVLRRAAKRAPVATDVTRYPDADHGFHCDARPSYHEASAKDGWRRTLEWFGTHLRAR
jgi:carboxymethylenebutenolidase